MPEICRFLGIVIYVYSKDHNPPHFHFVYGEFEGIMYIKELIVEGKVPTKIIKHLTKWSELHKIELLRIWDLAQKGKPLPKVEPLK